MNLLLNNAEKLMRHKHNSLTEDLSLFLSLYFSTSGLLKHGDLRGTVSSYYS